MNHLVLCFLLLIAPNIRSQDEPALTDLHGDKDSKKHIKDKIILRELHEFYPSYDFDNDKEKVPSRKKITFVPLVSKTQASVTLRKDSLSIVIESKSFDKKKHKFGYDKHYKDFLQTVDGRPIYGTDGTMPTQAITLTIKNGISRIPLPRPAYNDLFQPNLETAKAFLSIDGRRLYVYMMNSDGAGSYEIVWIFKDGKYLRRVVEHNC